MEVVSNKIPEFLFIKEALKMSEENFCYCGKEIKQYDEGDDTSDICGDCK